MSRSVTPRARVAAATIAIVVTLTAGCGDGDGGDEPASIDDEGMLDEQGEQETASTEGSVTVEDESFVEYADGLVVRLAKIDTPVRSAGVDVPEDHTLVRVTLALENTGTEPVDLGDGVKFTDVLYGENRHAAEPEAGYDTDVPEEQLSSDDPQRIVPGSTVQVFETAVVPTDEMGELAVTVTIRSGHYTPYTFTDIETML